MPKHAPDGQLEAHAPPQQSLSPSSADEADSQWILSQWSRHEPKGSGVPVSGVLMSGVPVSGASMITTMPASPPAPGAPPVFTAPPVPKAPPVLRAPPVPKAPPVLGVPPVPGAPPAPLLESALPESGALD